MSEYVGNTSTTECFADRTYTILSIEFCPIPCRHFARLTIVNVICWYFYRWSMSWGSVGAPSRGRRKQTSPESGKPGTSHSVRVGSWAPKSPETLRLLLAERLQILLARPASAVWEWRKARPARQAGLPVLGSTDIGQSTRPRRA